MATGEPVILVPGLWMPAASLGWLGRRLARHGFLPVGFGYRWIGRDARDNGGRLADFAGCLARRGSRVHLLGHSTGAVLLLRALADHPALVERAGRVLMLGPPYAGCAAADTLLRWPCGPRLLGRTLRQWLAEPRPEPDPRVEVGVIAGTRSLGLGSWVARLSSPNDGVVRLEETRVPGAVARLELPIGHSEMLLSRRVASQAANFLRHGCFALDAVADARASGTPCRDP